MKSFEDIVGVKFTWYDYSFFFLTLLFSIFIGVYVGLYKIQQTAKDYLLGGKSMKYIPVALSVIANNVNGILLLAVPADVYRYGISHWFAYFSIMLVMITSYWMYIPVFWKLQITSMFEYLKHRYDTKVCLLGSCCYVGYNLLLQPIIMYVPSLVLSTATGLMLKILSATLGVICTCLIIFADRFGGLLMLTYIVIAKAAYCGAWISLITVGSLVFGSLWYQYSGYITIPPLSVSTENCINLNITDNIQNFTLKYDLSDVPYVFRISFYWYIPMGLMAFAMVALTISFCTKNKETVNPDLLSPLINPFLSSKYFKARDRQERNPLTQTPLLL